MNSEDIFLLALNIVDPWFIKAIKLEKSSEMLFGKFTVEIDFKRGGTFLFSDGKEYKAYHTEVRTWKHLNFFEHECFLTARVPRIMDSYNKVKTGTVPWAQSGSGFTLLCEAFAMLLIEQEMPVSKVSQPLRETSPRIWRIFNHWISKAVSKDDLSDIRQSGGIDETSSSKGHNDVTIGIDIETKIQPLNEFIKTVKAHWSGIVIYLKSRITAGVIEGINNNIQLAKRRARGYCNISNFINMIYFLCGKLKFDYPQYPS
jgi:transposase